MKRFGLPLLWLMLPLLCVWLFIKGAGSVGRAQSASAEKSIRESVYRAAMTCYACEGAYPESFEYLCENYGVINRFVMVDCSHANSSKQTIKQIKTARSIIRERNKVIGSLMLESYLFEGRSDSGEYGVSRTDNCIGFEDTESLVKDLYDSLG